MHAPHDDNDRPGRPGRPAAGAQDPTARGEPDARGPAPDGAPDAVSAPPTAVGGEGPLEDRIVASLRTVYDPEIPVNIYDLGLIYKLEVDDEAGKVDLQMTLTSPNCPVAESLPAEVQQKVKSVDGVRELAFDLTFDPPWSMERLSEGAKLQLGIV